MVTVGRDAWATGNPALRGSSVMFLKPGMQVSVEDLNKGLSFSPVTTPALRLLTT